MGRRLEAAWTWAEIAALTGKALRAFHRAYGDRAKVARMVAVHLARARGEDVDVPCCDPIWWSHDECPARQTPWCQESDPSACIEAAPLVYARMIKELGRLPE